MAGVAVRRVDEQRKWQTVRAGRDGERAPLDAALYARQEDERDRLDWDSRSLRGRVQRWRTNERPWSELGGVIRGKPAVLDGWRHDLERHQRQDRAALGHAQYAYERAMTEPRCARRT